MEPNHPSPASLLDVWCTGLESGDPDQILALYHTKATLSYRDAFIQGRSELNDLLRSQRRKLRGLRVTETAVEHATPEHIRFTVSIEGRHGTYHVRNDWYLRHGSIMEHAVEMLERKRPAIVPAVAA